VDYRDITVVVQGPIISKISKNQDSDTAACLQSIRDHLPGAGIILSTWKGSNIQGLEFDQLVESEDPGGLLDHCGIRYNVNRQITSTRNALGLCKTKYALKMRTDCTLTSVDFIAFFAKHTERHKRCRIFTERLVCSDLYFRTPHKRPHPLLFHPSDVFQFGLTSDLISLWSGDLASESEIHLSDPQAVPWLFRERWREQIRFAEEQFVWINCLNRFSQNVRLDYSWQIKFQMLALSELSIINNFVPVTPARLGVKLPSRFLENGPASVYSYEDFLDLLDLYCVRKAPFFEVHSRLLQLYGISLRRCLGGLRRRLRSS
jgi:hypothetical protein